MTDPAPLPLRTERLVLRGARPDDRAAMSTYYSDAEILRYVPFGPFDDDAMAERVARFVGNTAPQKTDDVLTLVMEHEGAVVGDLMLRLGAGDPPSVAEIGWISHPSYGGRGLVTEGARALLDLAFGHYGLHRVFAQLDPRNTASSRLCERLGMTREAHLRQDYWSKGEWTDTFIYGLLRDEWERAR